MREGSRQAQGCPGFAGGGRLKLPQQGERQFGAFSTDDSARAKKKNPRGTGGAARVKSTPEEEGGGDGTKNIVMRGAAQYGDALKRKEFHGCCGCHAVGGPETRFE